MRFLCLVVVMIAASVARAEDIAVYEAEGDAQLTVADPRVTALDEAFARAVAMALGDLVPPDVRSARKVDLDRELIGHARVWIAKFTVTKDVTRDDRRQLTVAVRVDRDKMRAKLTELSISTMSAVESSKGRTATVLLRIALPTATRASYGQGAEKDLPGLGALASTLRAGALSTKRAPGGGAAAQSTGELPLDDAGAEALAAEVNAELALIAGVTVGAPVVVRGLATQAALVTAHVRLIERRGRKLIGQGSATAGATMTGGVTDSALGPAIDRALVAAMSDVLPPSHGLAAPPELQGRDTPVSEPGVVLVRLAAATPWALVASEQKYLAGAKGIQRAVLRRLSPNGWVIGVTTAEPVDRIAQIAKRAPTAESTATVKVAGDIVELSLAGAP